MISRKLTLLALASVLAGCGVAGPTAAPSTTVITQTTEIDGHLTGVAFKKSWTYQGDGGEFQVDLVMSRFALGKDAGNETHPARPGFTASSTCGDVSKAGIAAGVVKITTKSGDTNFKPEVFLSAKIDHNAMKGNSMIGIMRGDKQSCNIVGRLTVGGIEIALTQPLAKGESRSFPIFIVVQPNMDNDKGPAITADKKRLASATYNFETTDSETGRRFKVTSGNSFSMAETLKS